MKIKVFGILFFLSVLVCGGGIDSDSVMQAIIGAIATFGFGGLMLYETHKKDIDSYFVSNFANRPCYLPSSCRR